MRRYWCALFAIALSAGAVVGLADVAMAGVWDSGEEPRVQSVNATARMDTAASCPTFYATVEIESVGQRSACIGGGPRSIAIFYDNNTYRVAASATPGGKRYIVKGVCTEGLTCLYSAETDSIIERQFVNFPAKQTMVSRDVSRLLKWEFSAQDLRWQWRYNGPESKEPLRDAVGTPMYVQQIGMSKNGRWLAVELFENGIALVDMRDGSVRRVSDSKYLYGRGGDPMLEFAVADDGSAVVVSGQNGGFTFIRTTADCG